LAPALMAGPLGMRLIFTRSILIKMKAVVLTYFSSTKTQALFREAYSMDAALSPERLTRV